MRTQAHLAMKASSSKGAKARTLVLAKMKMKKHGINSMRLLY